MTNGDADDARLYRVVHHHQEQYSNSPHERPDPPGWRDAGRVGPRRRRPARIDGVWTATRPSSPRVRSAQGARR
ncbi:MbtH family NRPS accessory protein [Micromonospora wenchangensis]